VNDDLEPIQTIGLHIGQQNGTNFGVILSKSLFQEFIIPTLQKYYKYRGEEPYQDMLSNILAVHREEMEAF
jgi:hypothetical protein